MNFKEFNRTLRITMLLCIPCFIWAIIDSNYIKVFLHPRSVSLLKAAGIVLAILAMYNLKSFFRLRIPSRFDWKTAVLLLPFLFGIIVKPSGFSARQVMQKGLNSMTVQKETSPQQDTPQIKRMDSLPSQRPDTVIKLLNNANENNVSTTKQQVKKQRTIGMDSIPSIQSAAIVYDTINDTILFERLDRCYSNPQECIDKAIVMTGFIVGDTILGRHSFLLARMLVSCCAADAVPAGIYCITDTLLGMQESQWVRISGILTTRSIRQSWENEEHVVPILHVTKAEKTEKPENQYIYPYRY
jgi:putative membrane protein